MGVITITACSVKVAESRSKKHCIEIATPGRSYWVAAENPEDMHTWISSIRSASQQCFENMEAPEKPKSRLCTSAPQLIVDATSPVRVIKSQMPRFSQLPPPSILPTLPPVEIDIQEEPEDPLAYLQIFESPSSFLGYLDNTPVDAVPIKPVQPVC